MNANSENTNSAQSAGADALSARKKAALWVRFNIKILKKDTFNPQQMDEINQILTDPNINLDKHQKFCTDMQQKIEKIKSSHPEQTIEREIISRSLGIDILDSSQNVTEYQELKNLREYVDTQARKFGITSANIQAQGINLLEVNTEITSFLNSYINTHRSSIPTIEELDALAWDILESGNQIDVRLLKNLQILIFKLQYASSEEDSQRIIKEIKEQCNLSMRNANNTIDTARELGTSIDGIERENVVDAVHKLEAPVAEKDHVKKVNVGGELEAPIDERNSNILSIIKKLENYLNRTNAIDSKFKYRIFTGHQKDSRAKNQQFAKDLIIQLKNRRDPQEVLSSKNINRIKEFNGAKITNSKELRELMKTIKTLNFEAEPQENQQASKGMGNK